MAQNTPPGASPADDACSETSSESSLDSVDYEFFVNGSDDVLDGTIDPVDDLELGNDFIEGIGTVWEEVERAKRSVDGTPQPIALDPFGEGTPFNVWACAQEIYECIIDRFKSFRSTSGRCSARSAFHPTSPHPVSSPRIIRKFVWA